jgi:DNA-binding response OmpR family regulator
LKPLEALAIVEDDAVLREELRCFFVGQHYKVYEANNYLGLLEILKLHEIRVIVLDLNLPGINGYEIASRLKQAWPRLGVVMLTARTALADRIKGYEVGADVYLPKPTNPMEVLATIKSLSRRLQNPESSIDSFQLHFQARRLTSATAYCDDLTAVEVVLIRSMVLAPHQTLDIGELMDVLESKFSDHAITRRALENILSRLRKKLMTCFDKDLDPVKAIRGVGYQLTWNIQIAP